MRRIVSKLAILPVVFSFAAAATTKCSSDGNGNTKCEVESPSSSNNNTQTQFQSQSQSQSQFQCNIYLAPSSIPNAGFGLYTVKDIEKDERVLPFTDAPSIPLCDESDHGLHAEHWNHVDYLWSGKGLAEFECDRATESVMTFGSLCSKLQV